MPIRRPPSSAPHRMVSAGAALTAAVALAGNATAAGVPTPRPAAGKVVIAVHGGAGALARGQYTPEEEAALRAGLTRALERGYAVLARGGSSVDAVVAAVTVLEDDEHFNAGRGAVLTSAGVAELDASVMDGASGAAGAVAGATTIKNPITAAQAVMRHTRHVLLIGAGADAFARSRGLAVVEPAYFVTEKRRAQLRRAQAQDEVQLDHGNQPAPAAPADAPADAPASAPSGGQAAHPHAAWMTDHKYGTVGAVALDANGHLAAGTSTGGLTNKMAGRVGDSPIVGAGTWADDQTVAVSGTGTGEFFIRGAVAHDIAARMRYGGATVSEAVQATLAAALDARGGEGGVIALDRHGKVHFGFNTTGMLRGVLRAGQQPEVAIYKD